MIQSYISPQYEIRTVLNDTNDLSIKRASAALNREQLYALVYAATIMSTKQKDLRSEYFTEQQTGSVMFVMFSQEA